MGNQIPITRSEPPGSARGHFLETWLYSLDQWTAFGTGAKSLNGNILPASCSDILLLLAPLGRFVQLLCTS